VQVNNRLLKQIVETLDSIKLLIKGIGSYFLTVLDNSLHPEFDQLLGFDLSNTLNLAKEFHVTLQVEDPASEWTRPPSRYDQLAKTYTGLIGNIPLAIDINIVPVHPGRSKRISLQSSPQELNFSGNTVLQTMPAVVYVSILNLQYISTIGRYFHMSWHLELLLLRINSNGVFRLHIQSS